MTIRVASVIVRDLALRASELPTEQFIKARHWAALASVSLGGRGAAFPYVGARRRYGPG